MTVSVRDTDRGWRRIRTDLKVLHGSFVKVGILPTAGNYPPDEGALNLVDVALIQEFGTEEIPERPFMRQTLERSLPQTTEFIKNTQGEIFQGLPVKGGLEKVGVFYQGEVQKTFVEGDFLPNASSTIVRKGSSRPLIDTGRLRQSINHEVVLK